MTWSEDDAFQLYTDNHGRHVFTYNGLSTSYISGAFSAEVVLCATFIASDSLTYVVYTTGTGDSTLRNYSLLYDKNKRAALWVAYVMQDDRYPDNEVGRKTSWHYDPAIPEEDQPDLTSSYTEYNGISFDCGHQVASNSRQAGINQNKETYYFTNMTPQVAGFNRGKWSSLETKEQGRGGTILLLQIPYLLSLVLLLMSIQVALQILLAMRVLFLMDIIR